MTYYKSKNELELEEARKAQNRKIIELEEENKKLKEENELLKEAMKDLNNYNKFRIQENKLLKEKLEQIKETYIRFEDSEKEYNKWLWELDQLIMNR